MMAAGCCAAWVPGGAPRCARQRAHAAPAARMASDDALDARWSSMLSMLKAHVDEWGHADAPLNTELGRWCATQRSLNEAGKLDSARVAELGRLDFSWRSPYDQESPGALPAEEWEEMVRRFIAYRREHGDGQVPKKYRPDPALGGWVAGVRRAGRRSLSEDRASELDAAGFEWVSVRACGSAFMKSFRELKEFGEANEHLDVPAGSALARWCSAQRLARRKGLLPPKRVAYLDGIGFEWAEQTDPPRSGGGRRAGAPAMSGAADVGAEPDGPSCAARAGRSGVVTGYFMEDELRLVERQEGTAPAGADPFAPFREGDRVQVTASVSAGGADALGRRGTAVDVWRAGEAEEGEMGPCCSELDMAPITVELDETPADV